MTNPVDEYLQSKEAGFLSSLGSAWNVMKEPVIRTAAGVGTVAVGMAALKGMDNLALAITKKRDFNRMMDHNPDLREAQQEDPKRFNAQFTSLRTMNPTFSQDPIVAGTYMRQMVASPATAGTAMVGAAALRGKMPPSVMESTGRSLPGMVAPIPSSMDQEMHAARMADMGMRADKDMREAQAHQARMKHEHARHAREEHMHPLRVELTQEQIDKLKYAPQGGGGGGY